MPTKTKLVIKNGYVAAGASQITGSLNLSQGINAVGGFTGSLLGTALSASYIAGANVDGQVSSAAD